jgi:hypothetical protein
MGKRQNKYRILTKKIDSYEEILKTRCEKGIQGREISF